MRLLAWPALLLCTLAAGGCTPGVDPCFTANGGCDVNASCSSAGGAVTCSCKPGFSGNGSTCTDVDECATANGGCAVNANCINLPGGRACTCTAGFSGDGGSCADLDECAVDNGGCGPLALCTNTPGSRTCQCAPGYVPDAGTCTDEDECLFVKCTANAACVNQPGGYECRCIPGAVPTDAGTCVAVAEVVAVGLPSAADGLALDTAHGRLFATLDDGRIYAVPLDGGAASTLAPSVGGSPALHDIATDGRHVFWADPRYGDSDDGGIYYAPADGSGAPSRFAPSFTPFGLLVGGTTLYWSQQDGALSSAPLPAGPGEVATVTPVMDGFGFGNASGLEACGLTLVGTQMYFLDFWGGEVGVVPASGGAGATGVATGLEKMWGRSITSGTSGGRSFVYWTVPGFSARELWGYEVPAASGAVGTPVKLLTAPDLVPVTYDAVAADGQHVYWISGGQLLRWPLDAAALPSLPTPELLFDGSAQAVLLSCLALDDTHAYFATSFGRELMRVSK
jgi:hypothetical protein